MLGEEREEVPQAIAEIERVEQQADLPVPRLNPPIYTIPRRS